MAGPTPGYQIGAHWHKHRDEYMEVLEGRVDFKFAGKTVILKPGGRAHYHPMMTQT